MSANPALVQPYQGPLVPAPFPNEYIFLRRDKIGFDLDNVQTRSGKWSTTGTVFLSNFRLTFIAAKPDASGLAAFDLPLVYIHDDDIHQPIFGCNNLAGKCWGVAPTGGEDRTRPPHKFKISFKAGGIGTLYPMYYMMKQRAAQTLPAATAPHQPASTAQCEQMAAKAFVDPSDPSHVFLTQPVGEDKRLHEPPKFAANYGQDEKYEGMEPRQ